MQNHAMYLSHEHSKCHEHNNNLITTIVPSPLLFVFVLGLCTTIGCSCGEEVAGKVIKMERIQSVGQF
jgi:hypothetical protein